MVNHKVNDKVFQFLVVSEETPPVQAQHEARSGNGRSFVTVNKWMVSGQ
jgi:hypothetical protein